MILGDFSSSLIKEGFEKVFSKNEFLATNKA
jgi:hypothetical protein